MVRRFGAIALALTCAGLAAADTPVSIFYKSQELADADLMIFEKASPSCELWSNWQKTCSRTAEGGRTYCKKSRLSTVRPSTPFCVAGGHAFGEPLGSASADNEASRASRNRFCEKFGRSLFDPSENIGTMPVCEYYRSRRPFNGQDLREQEHPMCQSWGVLLSAGRRVIYCKKLNNQKFCKSPVVVTPGSSIDNTGIITKFIPDTHHSPIWGTYCAKRERETDGQ